MRLLRFLGRLTAYALVLLWAPAWLAAWWLWPPAPRSGWQIPAGERCLGFLSDSRHVLTEEITGKDKERTGTMYVRDINTGAARVSYTSPKEAYRSLDGDLLIETTRLKEAPIEYPPGGGAGTVELADLRVRSAWTGDAIFDDHRLELWGTHVCPQHGVMAYVRHGAPGGPEVVWRDLASGRTIRTFPGLAGPLDFSPSGSRLLAARWAPELKTAYTLLLIEVPSGAILHSIRVDCQPNWRFMPQMSGSDKDVFVQGKLYDIQTGNVVLDCDKLDGLMQMSNNGRHVIISGGHDRPRVTWRAVATGQDEIKHAFDPREIGSSSGWMGRFNERDFQWVNVGVAHRPQWPWGHRLAWLTKWLPELPERTYFIVADQNTGRIIVQGVGHRPQFVSPDGRLLVMEEVGSDRQLISNIPFDAGLPWPVAALAGVSLPAVVVWRRWRRG